jgi:hypothetical protein
MTHNYTDEASDRQVQGTESLQCLRCAPDSYPLVKARGFGMTHFKKQTITVLTTC